jgi:DNA-binding GntR family transcriptional regulator
MKKIRTTGATAEVTATLIEALKRGEAPPNSRLTEEKVAAQLGTSRVPVREALAALVAKGLLEKRGNQVFVPVLDPDDLREIYLARQLLESVMLLRAVENMTDASVAPLLRVQQSMATAIRSESIARLSKLNREFHFLIFRLSGLSLFLELTTNLWDRSEYYRAFYSLDASHRAAAYEEHSEMIEALRERDAGRLIRLHDAHREWLLRTDWPWMARSLTKFGRAVS